MIVNGCTQPERGERERWRARPGYGVYRCLNVSSVVFFFFELLGSSALCLHCLKLFYKLFRVVVDSVVFVSGCLLCFHSFNSR